MSVAKVLGIETEYGIAGGPDSDQIVASSIIVNAYAQQGRTRINWDFEGETPDMDARGLPDLTSFAPIVETHLANTVLTIAVAIYLETALAFLGLEDPTTTTWGTILEHAFDRAAVSAGAWWAIVPDGIVITLLIMGCFLLGQAIEDALNPRLRVAHLSSRRWALRPLAGRGPGAI